MADLTQSKSKAWPDIKLAFLFLNLENGCPWSEIVYCIWCRTDILYGRKSRLLYFPTIQAKKNNPFLFQKNKPWSKLSPSNCEKYKSYICFLEMAPKNKEKTLTSCLSIWKQCSQNYLLCKYMILDQQHISSLKIFFACHSKLYTPISYRIVVVQDMSWIIPFLWAKFIYFSSNQTVHNI